MLVALWNAYNHTKKNNEWDDENIETRWHIQDDMNGPSCKFSLPISMLNTIVKN